MERHRPHSRKDTDVSYAKHVKALTPLIWDRLVGADILIYSTKEYARARRIDSAFLRKVSISTDAAEFFFWAETIAAVVRPLITTGDVQ